MTLLVKCIPIPDKKRPNKFILKIIEPENLRGKIAFPIDFEPKPLIHRDYVIDDDNYEACGFDIIYEYGYSIIAQLREYLK